jgi:hypothetical protein
MKQKREEKIVPIEIIGRASIEQIKVLLFAVIQLAKVSNNASIELVWRNTPKSFRGGPCL